MRRGINQLEMVLAFIIFIAAIAGSVFFLQTFRAQSDQFAQAEVWTDTLIAAAQDEVTVTHFALHRGAIGASNPIALPVAQPSLPAILINETGGVIPSSHQTTTLMFNPSTYTKVSLVQSQSIQETRAGLGDVSIVPTHYVAGAPAPRTVLTEKGVQALQTRLTTAQTTTLSELGLPSSLSLNIAFTGPGISVPATVTPPGDREVRTVTRRVELMSVEGSFIFGTLQIAIW